LFLHGGGWRAGSRHLAGPAFRGVLPSPFEQVARAGIAVASAVLALIFLPRRPDEAPAAASGASGASGESGAQRAQLEV